MEVRARRSPGVPGSSDRIPALHFGPLRQVRRLLEVIVDREEIVGVSNDQRVAAGRSRPVMNDLTVSGSCENGPDRESNVDAVMKLPSTRYRVNPPPVRGSRVDRIALRPRLRESHDLDLHFSAEMPLTNRTTTRSLALVRLLTRAPRTSPFTHLGSTPNLRAPRSKCKTLRRRDTRSERPTDKLSRRIQLSNGLGGMKASRFPS